MNLWIGTSGFQYPEWKGNFYPEKMPASGMLPFYAAQFPTTEVNYSFRRIPSAKTIANWHAATPERFKFSFKAPQRVTHFAKLRDSGETIRFFYSVITAMDTKLGAVLFQLPPTLKKDVALLSAFLANLPSGMEAAFEFRHASWMDEQVFDALRQGNTALCIADSEDLTTPPVATASFGYLRLRREDYAADDLSRWADFVKAQTHWRDAYVYFKHEAAGVGPKFARTFQQLTNA